MFLKVDLNLLWTLLNIGVLYLLARRFLFKPLRAALAKRRGEIEFSLKEASDVKAEAQALKAKGEEWLGTAHKQALSIVDAARDRGDDAYDQIVASARRAARHITEDARVKLAHEEAAARERVKAEAVDLALEAASRLVSGRWTAEDDRALVEQYIQEAR